MTIRLPRWCAGLAALALVVLPACRVTDLNLWQRQDAPADVCAVERVRGVAYYDGPQADPDRHKLDLFLPKGKKDYPVVVLVHGGAWALGDNRCCGLYSSVGEFLASQGIGAVLPNYRLSPGVKHPEHIKDLARAFAWTRKHIAEHGGDPDQIFLVGHSAGGHLVALLAGDEKYLTAEGCRSADIKGVVGISGVYRIPPGKTDAHLFGSSPDSVRLDEMMPLRGESAAVKPGDARGLPVSANVFGAAFGVDPKARAAASPLTYVRPGLPPFLLLNAEKDLPLLPQMAQEMHEALLKAGCASQLVRIERRNHNSICFDAITAADPAAKAIVGFICMKSARAHSLTSHHGMELEVAVVADKTDRSLLVAMRTQRDAAPWLVNQSEPFRVDYLDSDRKVIRSNTHIASLPSASFGNWQFALPFEPAPNARWVRLYFGASGLVSEPVPIDP
jgi:acetyl esterase/lipase